MDDLLTRIKNYLLLNTSPLYDPGLFHGKTRIMLFFFHYARFTGKEIYAEYAEALIEEIYEDISECHTIRMESGLIHRKAFSPALPSILIT